MSKELIAKLRAREAQAGEFAEDAARAAGEIERLQAQFERLVGMLQHSRDELDSSQASAATLSAENRLLRADAGRYRWLRNLRTQDELVGTIAVRRTQIIKGSVSSTRMLAGEELDLAVDTAMRADQASSTAQAPLSTAATSS